VLDIHLASARFASGFIDCVPGHWWDQRERRRETFGSGALFRLVVSRVLDINLSSPTSQKRHVLAAASGVAPDETVTANVRDFPADILTFFEIGAQYPDEFVLHVLDLAPGVVVEAAGEDRQPALVFRRCRV
jgi:hypothetical protein